MNKTKALALLVPIFYVITLVFNGLAASGNLNGIATGEISDFYPVLFTPADYVFSIWSLIYLGLLGFSVYQLLPKQFKDKSLDQVRIWFVVTSVFNSLWLVAWQYQRPGVSLVIMLLLLVSLIKLYLDEQIGIKQVDSQRRWLVQAPFSLYLGWISVATIANVSVVLYTLGWDGFGLSDLFWTLMMMWTAVILAMLMIYRRKDYIYAGVIVWALMGIAVKNETIPAIGYMTGLAIAVLVGFSGYCVWSSKDGKKK